ALLFLFFFSSRRRHTRSKRDWSSDVCSSDLVIGLLIGLGIAFGAARLVSSLLYGVSPTDRATFFGVAAVLCAVTILACYLPARRTMRVDPIVALRYE